MDLQRKKKQTDSFNVIYILIETNFEQDEQQHDQLMSEIHFYQTLQSSVRPMKHKKKIIEYDWKIRKIFTVGWFLNRIQ